MSSWIMRAVRITDHKKVEHAYESKEGALAAANHYRGMRDLFDNPVWSKVEVLAR